MQGFVACVSHALTFVATQCGARIDLDSILAFFALHPYVWLAESVIIFAANKSTQLNTTQGLGSINIGLMLYISILRMSTVYFLGSVVSFQQSNSTASDGGQDVWIQALCCRHRAEAGLKAEDEIQQV